ncbi:hypothetical protein DSO57_1028186 [Entomophthora muscae]|uniref:Uncharacterized protein n=1 Tax=Entomophthora muscae TaxID=34485 RepID=A0ACC2RGB0_9FUNG|nr:hypothetical protein DSO57_1028186 [Entomophthora muscae]
MKPFLYQILLLLTLACLVPVLCQDNLTSKTIEHVGEVTKTLGHLNNISNDFVEVRQKLVTTFDQFTQGSRITLGVISVVVGILFLVVGKTLIRVIFALAGGCLFGGLAYYIGRIIEKHEPPSTKLLIGVAVVALVGMMLGCFLLKVGTVILGALTGVSITMLIARMKYFQDNVIWIVGVILVLGFSLLAYFLSSIIIIGLTSIIGSFIFVFGVDCFIEKGFSDFVVGLDLTKLEPPGTEVKIMIGATLFVAILGFLFQFCIHRKK